MADGRCSAKTSVKITDERGFSVIELLVSLTLMALLGTSLLTVIVTGGDAFRRIFDEKNAQSEARIALSYVTVRLRQNCSRSDVSIVPSDSPEHPGDVLKIAGAAAGAPAGDSLFIYYQEGADGGPGRLVEKLSNTPGVGDDAGAEKIADIDGFEAEYTDDTRSKIRVAVSRHTADGDSVSEATITLRAD